MADLTIGYIPSSHLDLFWLGNYKTCLERGAEVIKQYIDRCLATEEETFLLETVVFANYFLKRYPSYRDHVRRLVAEGRLEVGAAYIDRWETLVLGESHVRNIVIGKRWCQEVLGIDNPMVTHPDLPSMIPQIAQIYKQSGVRYYVTSRKVFEHGQVWRHLAPDGSTLLVLNYPRHYLFTTMNSGDVPAPLLPRLHASPLDLTQTHRGFPKGVIPVPGSAGDLADRSNFRRSYGQSLEAFVEQYRERYPDLHFTYTIPSRVLAAYEHEAALPQLSGEIPSVWGVAADEEVRFFQRSRRLEASLLTAETLAAVADHLGLAWRPEEADSWQGTFYEATFFATKDPIAPGRELGELWRMHVFTQDHNGGGQEGALSSFQKRVIQQRSQAYAEAITTRVVQELGGGIRATGEGLLVFNPHGQPWSGPLTLPAGELPEGWWPADETGAPAPAQVLETGATVVALSDVPSIGYRYYPLRRGAVVENQAAVTVEQEQAQLLLRSMTLEVAVDRSSGNLVHVRDLKRGEDWGHVQFGGLYAIEESGNDVTLRVSPDAATHHQSLLGIETLASGPLFHRVRIRKRLLRCDVEQTLTLWGHEARLDLETRIYWWGKHHQQVRMGMPAVRHRADITYGSPFYGVAWDEVVAGAGPRNHDEIAREDYPRYREAQGWLHLQGRKGGLTICSSHPAFHHVDSLEAVLLRTPPSCGDPRLYWENPGEQIFGFSFFLGEASWQLAEAPRLASQCFRAPAAKVVSAGEGRLPTCQSLLSVEGALLSALYPGVQTDSTVVRVYEAVGQWGTVYLSGPLAKARVDMVNLLEEQQHDHRSLLGQPGAWRMELPPWRIQTMLLKP